MLAIVCSIWLNIIETEEPVQFNEVEYFCEIRKEVKTTGIKVFELPQSAD